MRIIAKAKPIKIRIKSGGEEHSSLDSLRRNLCVQDLWPLIKDARLARWLRQLGEVELAHAIDELSEGQLDDSLYFDVLSLLLKDDLDEHHVTDLRSLFSFWHDCEMRTSKNYVSLRDYLLSRYEDAKFIYKQYAEDVSDEKWWEVFCDFEKEEDPEFLFKQGKLAFEGFKESNGSKHEKDIVLGKELIEKAAELGNPQAIDMVNSQEFGVARKLSMLTPEAKEKIDGLIYKWKIEMLGFSTRKTTYDEGIVWEVKQLLQEFASLRKTYNRFDRNVVREEAERRYNDIDESDIFFNERKFVLGLAQSLFERNPKCFEQLAEDYHYPLAQYMVRLPADERIDGFAFLQVSFPIKLRFVVDHLFKY